MLTEKKLKKYFTKKYGYEVGAWTEGEAKEAQRDDTERNMIKQFVEFVNWLDNGVRSCASWRSEVRKFSQALQKAGEK